LGWQTHGAECKALAAGAGVSSGTSSLDGSGAATGVRAGALLVTPLGAVGGSIGVVFLEQSTRLGSPLRSSLRSGEAVFHSSMPCACARRTGSI
jgi:hypothetical protein